MTEKNTPKNLPIIIAVAVVVLLGGAGIWYFTKPTTGTLTQNTLVLPKSTSPNEADQPEYKQPSLDPTTSTLKSSTSYKDGSYTVDGSYISPAGEEAIGVKATINGGKISSIAITPKATNSKSIRYQGLFADGISGVVVGKSLDQNLDPGVVNGSSLSGMGFVQAMNAIKLLAQK